jgi:acetolactate synthase-1/3 small subunit
LNAGVGRGVIAPRSGARGRSGSASACQFENEEEGALEGPTGYRRPGTTRRLHLHMKHIIALLLENEPGALSRVVALFSARGYNIESLTVAPTEDASLSRMTIVTTGSDEVIEQITKHLNRLIEVVKVVDLTEGAYTARELMLIKVRAVGKERDEMMRMAEIFRARIIDVTEKSYTIELTGDQGKLDAFIAAVDRAMILETVRTGSSGIGRGERILRV